MKNNKNEFFQKLFNQKSNSNSGSHLDKKGLQTLKDLKELVKPIIRRATKIEVQSASRPTDNSQTISHFGGKPYFEEGEEWPTSKNGKPLSFVFQIFNSPELEIPDPIKLIQFYYDWEEFPWDTSDDGWLVKIYENINDKNILLIENPEELEQSKYCEIKFKFTQSLPDWEGIELYEHDASKLSCILDEDEPWESYDQVVTDLIDKPDYQSQLGGYPRWVQGESTPKNHNGDSMKLLFQIDSEENAGLMWGDVGLIYVFYEVDTDRMEFSLQCH